MFSQPSSPAVLSVLFVIFLFIIAKRWRKSHKKLPPGPLKFPLVGNLPQLISSLPPHFVITNLAKKYGPVMSLQLGEVPSVVVSSAEAAKEVFKTKDVCFAQRPEVLAVEIMSFSRATIFFAPYGEFWKNFRKIYVNELLNTMRVQSARTIREEETWNFIEDVYMCDGTPINLSEKISNVVSGITSMAAFSKRCKDQGEFMSLLAEITRIAGGFNLPDLYPSLRFLRYATGIQPALEKIQKKMSKILDDLILEHKLKRKNETEHEDIMDVLLKLQESDQPELRMTNDNIKEVLMEIFSAGSETTTTAIEWAMAEMVKNPRVMKKAQAELRQALNGKTKIEEKDLEDLEYLKLVVKETLRAHPPAGLLPREAREDTEICGHHVPAKTKILINAWAISRHPDIWTEPDSFKPERFQFSTVDFKGNHFELTPFGGGRRICPGIPFSISNIELVLAHLLYHFNWSLPGGTRPEDLDMTETLGITLKKKQSLHLVPTVHIPFSKN